MWGSRIGALYKTEAMPAASFEYDREFQKSGIELAPLTMPLSERLYQFHGLSEDAFHGVPGLIADSLPDKFGNAVINRWLAVNGRLPESFTALDRLCYTGKRGMGALEYVPSTGPESFNDPIDVTEMTRFAADVLTGRESLSVAEGDVRLAQLLEIGASAGGARAKAVIAWNEKTGEGRSGQINAGEGFRYWILKFGGVEGNGDHGLKDKKQYTLVEYAYYRMALDCKIHMTESRIYEKDGIRHFLTERFDRVNGKKLHMQSLGAMVHADYNQPGLMSYEEFANCARLLGIGRQGIEQFFRRMVFNVTAVNCDDHVKNFSFLMDREGEWSLAPAYDMTFAYQRGNQWLSGHQMTINGKTNHIEEEDILTCGKTMGLSRAFCRREIGQIRSVADRWMEYAQQAGISERRADEIRHGMLLWRKEEA